MKWAIVRTTLALGLAAGPADAATFRATVYFQVVTPADVGLAAQVNRWQPSVKSDLQRHVSDLVDEMNQRIPDPKSHIRLRLNKDDENYIRARYQEPEFDEKYVGRNTVQISVAEIYKGDRGLVTRTDVYFGTLKGDLPKKKIEYTEIGTLKNPNRSASALKYVFTYAWAMDFEANKKPLLACPLLFKALGMERTPDIRAMSGLDPLTSAVKVSYARLDCAKKLAALNAH